MPRVSQETIDKLNAFLDTLPKEARDKCALCNETLTHIVKKAEAQTGAGTATVTRAVAERINESAAPGDRVSDEALRQRVIGQTTNKNLSVRNEQIIREPDNKPEPSLICSVGSDGTENKKRPIVAERTDHEVAMKYAKMAIADLVQIRNYHHDWKEALDYVENWITKTKKELT